MVTVCFLEQFGHIRTFNCNNCHEEMIWLGEISIN